MDIDVLERLWMRSGVGGMLDARPWGCRRLSSPFSEPPFECPSSLAVTVDKLLTRWLRFWLIASSSASASASWAS